MKKRILILILLFIAGSYLLYISCKPIEVLKETKEELKAIFISYIDYNTLKGKNSDDQKKQIDKMINNINDFGLNTIILQVRPFADAIYESKLFKPSLTVSKSEDTPLELDILKYFLDKSHEKNIKVHAWINPYRIRSTNDMNDISTKSIFYPWLEDSTNIEISKSGIYFNPASVDTISLIVNGVEEIIRYYDVDGIIYDDYFYPNETIDLKNYEDYIVEGGKLTLEEYRINNVNTLIKKTYDTIKQIDKNILFGISPAGNISNNLNHEYLDIKFLLNNEGYLDYIMPQIYFGFENKNQPYLKTIKEWNNLIKVDNINLYVALGIYKSGSVDGYALTGENEWIDNTDIIKKQVIVSRNESKYEGFSIFRYDFLFNKSKENDNLLKEINNLKQLIE